MDNQPSQASSKRDLSSGSLYGNLLRLTLPMAAQQALGILYNLVNAVWLGRWSTEGLGAPGVAGPIQWIAVSLAFGFGSAGTALVAQYVGARRHRDADHVAGQTMMLMTSIAGVLTVPAVLFAPGILSLYGTPEGMMPDAVVYLRIIMLGLPFVAVVGAYGSVLRALGDTMTVVVIQVIGNAINLALDPLLIFGWAPIGMPAMGVAGAATGTVISQGVCACACIHLLRKRKAGLSVTRADLSPDWPVLRQIVSIGTPAALSNASGAFGFSLFQGIINTLGTVVVSAYTVGFRILNIIQVLPQCLAMAAAPIVGQAIGAGNLKLARRAVKVCTNIVAFITLPAAGLLMWQGHNVARLFTPDQAVIAETGRFFLIVPISAYFFGLIMVLSAAFTGSGHTKPVLAVTILRLWLLRLPVGWLLVNRWHWGSYGVYWGMVAGNVVSVVILLHLFRRGGWQKAVVPLREGSPPKAVAAEEP
jgi:putative MATE family efflux protein